MHEMDRTPKVITIIALVLEGLNVIALFLASFLLTTIMDRGFFTSLDPNINGEELDIILELYGAIGQIMNVIGIVLAIIFTINLFIFVKLIKGNFEEKTAKKVYTYQFIWGIINIFINTIAGILHVVSGYQGMNGVREERNAREGI